MRISVPRFTNYPEVFDFTHGILDPRKQKRGNLNAFKRINEIFELCYGKVWTNKFIGNNKNKEAWFSILKSMTHAQIRRAVEKIESGRSSHNQYPPQILEFKSLGFDDKEDKIRYFCTHKIQNCLCMKECTRFEYILNQNEAFFRCNEHKEYDLPRLNNE